MNKPQLETAGSQMNHARQILIISHIRPDGDAVGSVLGLGLALQAAGKQVEMVISDRVPPTFQHLPGADQVITHPKTQPDLVVVLDCSDLNRIGGVLEKGTIPDLNIDHHITNLNFAKINLVDTQAVATAAILSEALTLWGLAITAPVAACLLNGVITDTLGFRTNNMNPKALRIAADLMDAGADLPQLYAQALVQRSFAAARLWGTGLSQLQRQGRIVWASLTQADRQAAGYPGRNDAELSSVLSSIQDQDIALIFNEQPNGRIKVSWRAQPGFDVSQIAFDFGGGGHPAAAGAEIDGDMESVQKRVLHATHALINQNTSIKHASNVI